MPLPSYFPKWYPARVQPTLKSRAAPPAKDERPDSTALTPNPPPTPTNKKRTAKRCRKCLPIATFAVEVLALFGLAVYAGLTYRMWQEMQNANKANSESFRTDERAWAGIEPIEPILKTPASGKFTASFAYNLRAKNTGKTVARCVEVRAPQQAALSFLTTGENPEWVDNWQDNFLLGKFKNSSDIPIVRSAPRVLAPGQVAPVPLVLYGQGPQIFPKGEFVSFLVGRIDYIDEFYVRHWVKFCFFVAKPNGDLEYCKYGNDEDNNPEIPPPAKPSCPIANPAVP